jgi:HK97 family phage portal protein
MGLFSNIFGGAKQIVVSVGTQLQSLNLSTNGVTGDPAKIGTVFTCCRVLSDNLSRMPLSVFLTNDNGTTEMVRHRLTYLLKFRPNNYQNAQQFWSTIEYHRNQHGNGFARVHKNKGTAFPESLEIIHPGYVKGVEFINGEMFYKVYNPETSETLSISAWNLLHFRGLSNDGVFGLSPLVAVARQTNINERATSTIDNFYKNNATSPMAIETDLPGNLTGPAAKAMENTKTDFESKHTGPQNAGKWIHLPIGTRLKSIAMQFADAKLIETLRFTREDISAAYGLPLFMVDGSAEKLDVEQLTTLFKNNTMGPVTAIYTNEINGKLLTRAELTAGFSVAFDVFKLIAMDYATKVAAIKEQTTNALMTPNEGAKQLGNKPIPGKWGNLHYSQAQYIPLENRDKYDVLVKTDPTLKTVDKK